MIVGQKKNLIKIRLPKNIFNERFHLDRIQINDNNKPESLISIKPNSFSHNFIQYSDVFAGLQYLTNKYKLPWKIYYRELNTFREISMDSLSIEYKKKVITWAINYRS